MADIKTVAIAGASGTLGPHVLKALIDAGFQVIVLTRSSKPGAFDATVKVVEVDFASVESLTGALQGADAVVSTLGMAAIPHQTVLIDAAAAAGVKRFIPSEYGSVSTNPKVENIPVYATMFKMRYHLQDLARSGKMTWTVLACGAFLEFLFGHSNLVDFERHKARLIDEGDNRLSSTSMPKIGTAIAAVLRNADVTANKVMYVSEVILTQNKVLRIAKELRSDIKWDTTNVQASDLLNQGLEELKNGDYSMPVILKVLGGTAMGGDKYGAAYDENDNRLLGVKELTEEELKGIVAKKVG